MMKPVRKPAPVSKPAPVYIIQFGSHLDGWAQSSVKNYLERQFAGVKVLKCDDLGEFQKALNGDAIPAKAQVAIVIDSILQSHVLNPHDLPRDLQKRWDDTHPPDRGRFVLKHLETLAPGFTWRNPVIVGVDSGDYHVWQEGKGEVEDRTHVPFPMQGADATFLSYKPVQVEEWLQRHLDLKPRDKGPAPGV